MELSRKRSITEVPIFSSKGNRKRDLSTCSEIIPRSSATSSQETTESKIKLELTPPDTPLTLSKIGFQSVLENTDLKRSRNSILSQGFGTDTGVYGQDKAMASYSRDHQLVESSRENISNSYPINPSTLSIELYVPKSNANLNNNTASQSSNISKGKSTIKQAAMKLFRIRPTTKGYQDSDTQSTPWTRVLHSQYGKHHKSYTTNNATNISKAVYSQSQGQVANISDASIKMVHEVNFDSNDIQMLQDLIKNIPSFEASFNQFTIQEQDALLGNIWGLYCNLILSMFKNERIWQLPAKIEDINRVLKFYIKLKQNGKVGCSGPKFLTEILDCLRASLYVLETQVLYSHSEDTIMNSALKRLCAIWGIFYKHAFSDAMTILAPLEVSFQNNPRYWLGVETGSLSTAQILYQMFRDVIVIPYYQTFLNYQGMRKNFQAYITEEDEKHGVSQTDKLTLLQCFGILASLNSRDMNQKIVDELLMGVRMSI
ncbi:Bit61p Ecym_6293 [Eremothecium cymbalariae DBVPG|uniref:Target of rapamycin complex 2 subunit BIT2 n=1 Tax=Eremothecium cymbalariae (strain CBS 270.75 / DBVPG 7215 / KCTC 17166 / NRRL Y-17582) TaxID=931890 RepID=G8JVJ4_ERECY|nr:hypothetical protein Ecym_6293 [Eremothecium cymbalariae DBVPG\